MKNIKFFLILFLSLFIFTLFFFGLKKDINYYPTNFEKKVDFNFNSKDLFTLQNISLNEILKKDGYTLLNIWSSWCLPCRKEHKMLMELKNSKNLNMIGLNYKDETNNAKNFILENGNPFQKIFIDNDGTKSVMLGAYGVPEPYLIKNDENIIIKKYIGILNLKNISEIIKILK